MMQLGQQSKWQSWMRMLALNIQPAHEPRLSTARLKKFVFFDWRSAATDEKVSIAAARNYPERRDRL